MRWSQRKAKCCKTITCSTFLFLHKHEIFPTFWFSPKSLLKESSKHCRYNSNPWN